MIKIYFSIKYQLIVCCVFIFSCNPDSDIKSDVLIGRWEKVDSWSSVGELSCSAFYSNNNIEFHENYLDFCNGFLNYNLNQEFISFCSYELQKDAIIYYYGENDIFKDTLFIRSYDDGLLHLVDNCKTDRVLNNYIFKKVEEVYQYPEREIEIIKVIDDHDLVKASCTLKSDNSYEVFFIDLDDCKKGMTVLSNNYFDKISRKINKIDFTKKEYVGAISKKILIVKFLNDPSTYKIEVSSFNAPSEIKEVLYSLSTVQRVYDSSIDYYTVDYPLSFEVQIPKRFKKN
ncbi:hypothetical protein [Sediminitomix flava]|uniref:Uncharacterized protein n=1 Tax=Sediminitomix flava TaxID=379075 RepID=A0A315YSP4_SEDFL|nr:hypothetical protein [Sediminitomix flava]PWJ31715.1 hypothetical protein BC781_1233 [Sediminitomix flava]